MNLKNDKITIHLIAAARPNFMKIAPLYHSLKKEDWANPVIVHTGQHYDINMSDAFFKDLELPDPHIQIGVGSGSHAEQTGNVMIAYEKIIMEKKPDMVIVVGDVNSTVACTLAAIKVVYPPAKIKKFSALSFEPLRRPIIAHLEAGLRSFDKTMPEEINRIVTDSLADILWTPSADGDENLKNEGVAKEKVQMVGNIMIDSLEMLRYRIESASFSQSRGVTKGNYGLVTLHRPANVDDPQKLEKLCDLLCSVSEKNRLIFPVHPRTRKNLQEYKLLPMLETQRGISILEPLNYINFMNLVFNCGFVITDSGGIQEETTYLGVPCFTLRDNTERPVTITQGTNVLCNLDNIYQHLEKVFEEININQQCKYVAPELWDGKTAERVTQSIKKLLIDDI